MVDDTITAKAADIVAAYVSNHQVSSEDLPGLIQSTIMALSGSVPNKPTPAVPIDESVTDDYLICLEDGQKVTLLKRYLSKHHGMTPEEYIEKWGLPEDYPFVTKSYSEKRSEIAKEQGLGHRS